MNNTLQIMNRDELTKLKYFGICSFPCVLFSIYTSMTSSRAIICTGLSIVFMLLVIN